MKRRQWSSKERFQIVMEDLSGKADISRLCTKYQISQSQYYRWSDQLLKYGHRYCSSKTKEGKEGPYHDRKRIMKTLCKKARVRYFRYHALRHLGASILDNANVNIGSIQRILGHENRTTTEIYLHSIGKAEREAMNIFESFYKYSHPNSHPKKKKGLTLIR